MKWLNAFAVICGLSATDVHSCSCVDMTAEKQAQNAKVIFAGKAVRSELLPKSTMDRKKKTTFRIINSYKGAVAEEVAVFSAETSSSCGVDFVVGGEYIVLVDSNSAVSLCTGNGVPYRRKYQPGRKDLDPAGLQDLLEQWRLK